jgi:hypothetical protein
MLDDPSPNANERTGSRAPIAVVSVFNMVRGSAWVTIGGQKIPFASMK